jgi:hypothetical protein
MITVAEGIQIGLAIVGGATIIFRALIPLAELTETKKDDNFIKKVIQFLTTISGTIALNKSDSSVKIKIK